MMKIGLHLGLGRQRKAGLTGPTFTTLTLTGTQNPGETLTCTAEATGAGTVTYSYDWLGDAVTLSAADQATYVVQASDDETTISCRVTATDDIGNRISTTNGLAITYLTPVISAQPTMTPASVEPAGVITLDLGAASDSTGVIDYFTLDTVDVSGDLAGLAYTGSTEGQLLLRVGYTNSGGTTYSNVIEGLVNTLPVLADVVLDAELTPAELAWSSTESGSVFWSVSNDAATTGAEIEAGGILSGEFLAEPGANEDTIDLSTLGVGTYSFNTVLKDVSGEYSNLITQPLVRAAPTISSVSPTDNATGVAITANPAATFSENIAFGTGTVVLRANDGGWADLEVFDVEVDIGGGAGTVSIAGAVLTIEPTADLVNELEYAVRIAPTAITDISGTAFAGIADDTTWSFTTEAAVDTTAPVLSSPTDAANGATAATGSVSTDEGNGTLYAVCTTSATAPTAAQVKLGQDNAGAAAAWDGSQAVSGTGVQTLSPAPSGLTAETAYTIHFMHEDAATNQSTVASGDGFTTEAAGGAVDYIGAVTYSSPGGTGAADTRSLTSLTGGSGSAPSAGDIVLVAVSIGTDDITTYSGPAGYTALLGASGTLADGTVDCIAWLGYKVMGETPDTTVDVPASGHLQAAKTEYITVWSGVDVAAMVASLQTSNTPGTALPDPPAVTPTVAGSYVQSIGFTGHDATNAGSLSSSDLTDFQTIGQTDSEKSAIGGGYIEWTSGEVNPAQLGFGATDSSSWSSFAATLVMEPAS